MHTNLCYFIYTLDESKNIYTSANIYISYIFFQSIAKKSELKNKRDCSAQLFIICTSQVMRR